MKILASSEVPDPTYFITSDLGNQSNLLALKARWNDLRQQRDILAPRQTQAPGVDGRHQCAGRDRKTDP